MVNEKVYVLVHDQSDDIDIYIHHDEKDAVQTAMNILSVRLHLLDDDAEERRVLNIVKSGTIESQKKLALKDWWKLTGNTETFTILQKSFLSY